MNEGASAPGLAVLALLAITGLSGCAGQRGLAPLAPATGALPIQMPKFFTAAPQHLELELPVLPSKRLGGLGYNRFTGIIVSQELRNMRGLIYASRAMGTSIADVKEMTNDRALLAETLTAAMAAATRTEQLADQLRLFNGRAAASIAALEVPSSQTASRTAFSDTFVQLNQTLDGIKADASSVKANIDMTQRDQGSEDVDTVRSDIDGSDVPLRSLRQHLRDLAASNGALKTAYAAGHMLS